MEPIRRSTRGQRRLATTTSPLQVLDTTKQKTRTTRPRVQKEKPSENDDANTQSQETSTTNNHTSPSQSPQPHDSHSEPERLAESRSTSPSDQHSSEKLERSNNNRSTTPSRFTGANGKAMFKPKTPRTDGGKKRAARPKTASRGPPTHQGVGSTNAHRGKREYKDMASASDADGEGADERPTPKLNKTEALAVQEFQRYKQERQSDQAVPSLKRQLETADSEDEESPAKRVRPNTLPKSSPPAGSVRPRRPRARSGGFSGGPFSYAGGALVASPSAENPFAMLPQHHPFGSSPKTASQAPIDKDLHKSPAASYVSTPLFTKKALIVEDTPSLGTPSQYLAAVETSPKNNEATPIKNGHNTPRVNTSKKPATAKSSESPLRIQEPVEDSILSSPFQEPIGNSLAAPNMFTMHQTTGRQSRATSAINNETPQKSHIDESDSEIEQEPPRKLAPFVTHISNPLPPRPASSSFREIPKLTPYSTPYINLSEPNPYEFEDSLVMSDDDVEIDVEGAKRKGRAWKSDYRKAKAMEKQAKDAMAKLRRGELLSPQLTKQSPSTQQKRRKQGSEQSSASRNSMRTSNSLPTLVFPSTGLLPQITVSNPNLIDFLRTIHDQVVIDNSSSLTLPDPKEVVALLSGSTPKQSSETTTPTHGQKAAKQHGIGGSGSRAKTPTSSPFSAEVDYSDEELSAEEDEGEDTLSTITNGDGPREVAASPAVPQPPATPTPVSKSGGWYSSLKSVTRALAPYSPFKFKGTSPSTNLIKTEEVERASNSSDSPTKSNEKDAQTEFTFAHEHNIANTQVTPTRPSRKTKAQSERRHRTKSVRSSGPQTERKRRQSKKLKSTEEVEEAERLAKLVAYYATPEFKAKQIAEARVQHNSYCAELDRLNAKKVASSEFAASSSKARSTSRLSRVEEVDEEENVHVYPNSFRAPTGDISDDEDEDVHMNGTTPVTTPVVAEEKNRGYGFFYDDSESEIEEESEEGGSSVAESNSGEVESGTARTDPPPTPRPSNAQLPHQRYVPKKPSGLRNVSVMSPIHKESQSLELAVVDPLSTAVDAVTKETSTRKRKHYEFGVTQPWEFKTDLERRMMPVHIQEVVFAMIREEDGDF